MVAPGNFAVFGRAIVARCPKTRRLNWFPLRQTETDSHGTSATYTSCRHCWPGFLDYHTVINERHDKAASDVAAERRTVE